METRTTGTYCSSEFGWGKIGRRRRGRRRIRKEREEERKGKGEQLVPIVPVNLDGVKLEEEEEEVEEE